VKFIDRSTVFRNNLMYQVCHRPWFSCRLHWSYVSLQTMFWCSTESSLWLHCLVF
jgi:hypothetical protein